MINKIKQKGVSILRTSEKYTKTDMTYLVKGGFWLSFARIISSIAILGSAIIFANFLSKEVYGTYKFIVALAATIAAVSLSGMGTAIVRAVARGFDGALRVGTRTALKWNSALFFIGLVGAIYYYINNNNNLAIALLIVAIFLPFRRTFSLYDSYLQGKKLFKLRTLYSTTSDIFPAIVLILVALFSNNFLYMVFAFFFSHTLINTLFYFRVVKKYKLKKEEAPETISYGKHLSLMNLLKNVAAQADKILLFHYLGPAQLAIYSFATAAPRELGTFAGVLQTLVLPKVSTADKETLKKTLLRKILITISLSTLLYIAYFFAAPYIFKFAFPAYMDSVFLSQIFALIILFFFDVILTQTLVGQAQKDSLYILNTVIPTAKIVMFFVLLPLFGIWGVVFTILSTRFVKAGLLFYFVFKKM